MPESLIFSVRYAMRGETSLVAYTCPNGHPYFIGECTRPWVESKCLECGAVIGGRLHVLAKGNAIGERQESEEAGYQVETEKRNKNDPVDRMSKQGVVIVHFILHACMMIGLENDCDEILRQIDKTDVSTKAEANAYLIKKMKENINDLSEALGRNFDDAVLTFHKCFSAFIEKDLQMGEDEPDWSTMVSRGNWEMDFREEFLLPVLGDLDNILKDAQEKSIPSENRSDMIFYGIIHEVINYEQPVNVTWQHPMLWKTIKRPNAAHLLQSIGDRKSTGCVLQIILQMPELHLAKHLEEVLKLQKILIDKFQNQKDLKEVESISFRTYELDGGGHKHRELIDNYIKLWNSMYQMFNKPDNGEILQYLQEINETSPISMALPSSRGRGRCARLLAEYLIGIHNSFLENCAYVIKDPTGLPKVEVPQLSTSNYIRIEKLSDLLPMIYMHTSYTVTEDENGRHHKISYNIDALEKQAREKYVMYKPLIDSKSLPCIKYPQDIGIGSDWGKLLENIPQEPLTPKLAQEVDDTVASQRVTPADVCEGVRTLTYAISFLAKIKATASEPLQRHLKDNLLLTPTHVAMIPKSALISHTLSLYQRLMWHKAKQFVQQGLDPYREALYEVDQEEIKDQVVLRELKEAFEHMDMGLFQQRLNETLIQVPDFNPNWSLKEQIFPFLEFIGNGASAGWYERIPEKIYFKNIAHLFQLSVKGITLNDE